jgi:hypothetical protein
LPVSEENLVLEVHAMSDYAPENYLARIAGEIMFGDQYLDLLERIYSTQGTIDEFESDPKGFLMRSGIHIPGAIDVIIHDSGAVGRPARVDFHWDESAQILRSDAFAGRQKLRELARLAWDTLHSREMMQLRQSLETSPTLLSEFISDPRAYAAAHLVNIPEEIEIIVHQKNRGGGLRIDAHFDASTGSYQSGAMVAGGGCCYCGGGECCYYYRD